MTEAPGRKAAATMSSIASTGKCTPASMWAATHLTPRRAAVGKAGFWPATPEISP